MLAGNDPAEQEKLIKRNTLLANLVIIHNAPDIMDVARGPGSASTSCATFMLPS